MSNSRRGFTLIELAIVIGIILIIGVFIFTTLPNGKNQADLNSATTEVAAVLRQAQSQAMEQSKNAVWGIYFSNPTSSAPFYALFSGSSYASGTIQGVYRLPPTVAYITSTIPLGSSESITFSQITGASSASTSVGLYLISNPANQQYLAISGIGQVSYSSSTPSPTTSQEILVADINNYRVEEFNSSGVYQSQIGCTSGACTATTTNGGFGNEFSGGIAVDGSGNIWVSDGGNNRVEKFNSSGVYQSQIGCTSGGCTATTTNGGFNGQFYGLGGIVIDGSGNIWVSDGGNNRVEKFNSSGVYQSQIGCTSGGCTATTTNGGFNTPTYIAIDASGNIWVTDSGNNRVEKFNSSGVYQSQLGCASGVCTATSTNGGFALAFGGPGGLAIDASGNIWVTDGNNYRVEKFNSSGVYQSQLGCTSGGCTATSTNGGFASGFYGLNNIAIDASGNVWVTDSGNNRVEKFNSSGVYQSQLGCASGSCTTNSANGGFYTPASVAYTNFGASSNPLQNIWVIDELNNRVEKFNSSTVYQLQLGCASGTCAATSTNGGFESLSGFINIDALAADPSGNIWVSDYQDSRVEKFNSSGVYQSQLGCSSGACTATTTSGGLDNPGGVAIDSSGNIWIADFGANRVDKFNSSGVYQSQIGCTSGACPATSTNGGFNDPAAIAVDSNGNIWVADFNNSRVEKFNSSGVYQSQLGCSSGACTQTSTSGFFNYPNNVAVDSNGNIWVADYQNNRVEKFNSSGVYQLQLGCASGSCATSSGNGGFGGAYGGGIIHGLAADSNGNIWVSDEGDNRVEKFNSSGVYQTQIGCASGACTLTSTNGSFNYTGNVVVY